MKFALVFAVILSVSAAKFSGFGSQSRLATHPMPAAPKPVVTNRVASSDQAIDVLRYNNDVYPDGSYRYDFETVNGIAAQAQGTPRNFGGNPPVAPVVSQGSFSWTSPEGQLIYITYVADENGYQPSGDAIPTPPTPADLKTSILSGLQSSRNKKPKGDYVVPPSPPVPTVPSETRTFILSGLSPSRKVVNDKPKTI